MSASGSFGTGHFGFDDPPAGDYDVQRKSGHSGPEPVVTSGGPVSVRPTFATDITEHEARQLAGSQLADHDLAHADANPSQDPERNQASRRQAAAESNARQGNPASVDRGYRQGGENR